VKIFSGDTGSELHSFPAYAPTFSGGVRVAAGDINNDGVADIITGAGPGAGPHVKVFDGISGVELRSFLAFSPTFDAGIFVAGADVNGDGFADLVTGADGIAGGGPHVKVFDGVTGSELHSFLAYSPTFAGGVRVAAGDVNADGIMDVITGAGPGAGPHVKVFDGASALEVRSFLAYSPSFEGGVFVAGGDLNGDGFAEIITGTDAVPGGGPHVKVFDGQTGNEVHSFFAYTPSFSGGVRVAAGDLNGDGYDEIITGAGAGGGPHVKVFDGRTGNELLSFLAYGSTFDGGVYVAARSVVPEPSSTFLLVATSIGLLAMRRRQHFL
jgi:hypothetical protein